MTNNRDLRAVLFDLDGTLVDTAPDMVGAVNDLRRERGLDLAPFDALRAVVSHGSLGLVNAAFGTALDDDTREQLIARFLVLYEQRLCRDTRLFADGDRLLDQLDAQQLPWGIVTNKPGWLTTPLVKALGIACRAGCIISGDTFDERKPHPRPLVEAARQCGVLPAQCVYVGDAERDIVAGRAAGMRTLIARYGYIHHEEDSGSWGADGMIDGLGDILGWLASVTPPVAAPNES